MKQVFSETAEYYDKIYSYKDYPGEVRKLRAIISRIVPNALSILDVACGTGMHLVHLVNSFSCQGVDICEKLLEVARNRVPDVPLHHGDMTDFELSQEFDVVLCLFSAIGYVRTLEKARTAIECMARHLRPGGVMIIEPWFTRSTWREHTVHGMFINDPELKIARISTSFTNGNLSIFDLHHLIGTPMGTEHLVEHHELGLFEIDELQKAIDDAGLKAEFDSGGLTGRGLHIGIRMPAT